ncbi:MAG: hypothetical protein Q7U02_09125 [Desulfosalsimonadaceae bacterium]|nr:hypothetical protein [Desulfosalsimonadaceae bacterium]
MEKKEALSVISEKLAEGQSKQEIYTALLSKVSFKSDLMQYLAMVPTQEDRIKCNRLNKTLFYLLMAITVLRLLVAALILCQISLLAVPLAVIVPFLSFYFALAVYRFRGNMYRPLGMIGIAGLLKQISTMENILASTPIEITLEILFCILSLLVIILAYYIGAKAFPHYGFWGNLNEKAMKLTVDPG